MEVVNALGRRKRAVARVFVSEGTGKITINKRDLAEYFPSTILQYVVKQPLTKVEAAEKYDIKVNLCGGGLHRFFRRWQAHQSGPQRGPCHRGYPAESGRHHIDLQ